MKAKVYSVFALLRQLDGGIHETDGSPVGHIEPYSIRIRVWAYSAKHAFELGSDYLGSEYGFFKIDAIVGDGRVYDMKDIAPGTINNQS